MKKIFLCFILFLISSHIRLMAQNPVYYLSPGEKTVSTGSIVTIKVMFGYPGDSVNSISAPMEVSNWRVNGEVSENLLAGPTFASYQVPDQVPAKNPVAISCDVQGSNNTERVTVVSNITVEDKTNEIVLNGVTYKVQAGTDISVNKISASNVRGIYTNAGTVCTLAGSGVNIAILFPGNKTGTFKWNDYTAVGGSVNNQAYGSLDPNTKKSAPGQTIVTEYGGFGEMIKGTFNGVLWTQVGPNVYSVPVTGTFCVVHTE